MLRRRGERLLKSVVEGNFARRHNASLHGSAISSSEAASKGIAARIASSGLLKSRFFTQATPYKVSGCAFSTAAVTMRSGEALVKGGSVAQKQVSRWLYICCGGVFGMVVLGGMTRLTRSGLSMTDWKFTGELPPLSAEGWEREFDKYKQSPEYRTTHKGMSLEEFKFIYWMEYVHRMAGRVLGVVFVAPCLYFSWKGYFSNKLIVRLSLLAGLGASQGLVGWWMVKSGLEEPAEENMQARVSPYRLASHLFMAFFIYSSLLWNALSVSSPEPISQHLPEQVLEACRKVRWGVLPLAGLVGLTALSGAFVAGNDAGRAYNTFPKMGDDWIPEGILEMKPVIRNFFENTATVQFDHRVLATTTLLSVGALWLAARKLPLPPRTSKLLTGAVHMSILQVSLGIYTLLTYVPPEAGVAHQAGALTLFTIMLALLHTLRKPSALPTQTTRLMSRLKAL